MDPLPSPFGDSGQTVSDGAFVSLSASGPASSQLAADSPTAAKLTFEGRFIDRVRAQGDGDETRILATLEGQLSRSAGRFPTLTFAGSTGDDGKPAGLVPDEVIDDDSDDGSADSDSDSDDAGDQDASEVRVLRFSFDPDQFVSVLPDSGSDTTELLVRLDPTSFHYLEVSVKLEVAGATEAASTANDVLDVLITARNPGHHSIISLRLTDETGQAMASAACRIVSGATPADKGADPSALTADGNGIVRLKTDPAAKLCELAWGADATDLPFSRKVYLDLGGDAETADARRLVNLGYPDDQSLEDNVYAFQADFSREPTGRIRDIRDDLRAFHDDGVTPSAGDATDPSTDAIALNEGPTSPPDDLTDDATDADATAFA